MLDMTLASLIAAFMESVARRTSNHSSRGTGCGCPSSCQLVNTRTSAGRSANLPGRSTPRPCGSLTAEGARRTITKGFIQSPCWISGRIDQSAGEVPPREGLREAFPRTDARPYQTERSPAILLARPFAGLD